MTSLNDVLIPHLKSVFEMTARTMLIQFTFFGTYFVMSVPAGKVVARVGTSSASWSACSSPALVRCVLPAARMASFELFLPALFVLASGIILLQVSANPYISLLGAPRARPAGSTSRRH